MPKRNQEQGRIYDIEQWNKMKEELKNNLIMEESIKNTEFIEQLIRDVKIINFDRRPGWHPYSDEVMKKKIEEHYKRIGENVYNKVSTAIEEIKNQVDVKRQRIEINENDSPNLSQRHTRGHIGGKKRGKSRRRMRGKRKGKTRRKNRRKSRR